MHRAADAVGDDDGVVAPIELVAQDHELVTAEPGDGVTGPDRCSEPLRDRDEEVVTGGMAEAVVDHLEVVDIQEQHRDRTGLAAGALERVVDAVEEQCPIGESREGVVEGLTIERSFERPSIRDVTAVEHDRLDVGIVEEVRHDRVELAPAAVGMAHPARDLGGRARPRRQHLRQLRTHRGRVVGMDDVAHSLADQLVAAPSEHRPHGRALVGHDAVPIDQRDDVRGVLDERSELALVARPEPLFGRLNALQGETHLRTDDRQRREERLGAVRDVPDDDLPPHVVAGHHGCDVGP